MNVVFNKEGKEKLKVLVKDYICKMRCEVCIVNDLYIGSAFLAKLY